jgi:L-serine dehydratase
MASPSILNDVLGPVMRGPSSSHTAGSHHIALVVRSLLGEKPVRARLTFDPSGSYARTYREQGVDLAFATGLVGKKLTDEGFDKALARAGKAGLRLEFRLAPLRDAAHPNTVEILLVGKSGQRLEARAESTGGGTFLVTRVEGFPVRLDGRVHEILVHGRGIPRSSLRRWIGGSPAFAGRPEVATRDGESLLSLHLLEPGPSIDRRLASRAGIARVMTSAPVYLVQRGGPLFHSAADIVRIASRRRWTLGRTALAYESDLLGLPERAVTGEILARYDVMKASVDRGLAGRGIRMQLLRPTARKIWLAEKRKQVSLGGPHTRAAARALAAMHVSNSMGVVCAAPTGGSAGVIPGVVVTMAEEWKLPRKRLAEALLAASAVGLVVAERATFAAEIAGCQVEIGAAGAMGAAAVVEASGGTARQALDAAAISFQNTMGSVCDLVQGMCEIPCHTRNAAAASNAFLCADLILGGYKNPVPLDDTVDAVYDSGKMLPSELRVTARGGLALAPSARRLPNLRQRRSK